MKLATAAYQMSYLQDWQAYCEKIESWVADAAGQGADLLVFPEYGAMELATLDGPDIAADLEASLYAVSQRIPQVDVLHAELAKRYSTYILAASAPVFDPHLGTRPVNRARFFSPNGQMGFQDKQIMTRFEREDWDVVAGTGLQIFDTHLGRIGILICYDSEFPLLGRALQEADILLVPSCTDTAHGYHRVRIGATARALENQCITVMSSTVGECDWSPAVDENAGCGGIFGPPDLGFPPDGVLACGSFNQPGWTYAELDKDTIARVRTGGAQLNRLHWQDQSGRDARAAIRQLP